LKGLYIYSWNGDSKRQVAERNQMSAFHGSSMEAGLITKGYDFEVYQKVQYGKDVTILPDFFSIHDSVSLKCL
jgi:hypothetical protein